MGFHGLPHWIPNSTFSPKLGGRSPKQNLYCDWVVNGESFGSSKQIVPNMEDFHGVQHPTPYSSTPPPNGGRPPITTKRA